MSDRTYLRTYIYACPADEQAAALAVLRPDAGPGEQLALGEPYPQEQASCGHSAELAELLAEAAPGASFILWEDPAGTWLGQLHARTPGLGDFTAECTAAGDVVLTLAGILEILGAAEGLAAARAALHRQMAGPWTDDWTRAGPRNHPGGAATLTRSPAGSAESPAPEAASRSDPSPC